MAQKVAVKKGKTLKKQTKKTYRSFASLDTIFYILLLVLVFYPPFFRGMYFEKEMFPTIALTSAVFIIWAIFKIVQKEPIISTTLDYAALSLVVAYIISSFFAVNIRASIGEVLRYFDYLFMYFMVSRTVKDNKKIFMLLNVLVLSSFVVAVVGLGSSVNLIHYNGSWVGGRINSTFQYPNTTASFLMAFFLVNLALISYTDNKYLKAIYGVTAYTQFYAYVFTLSRGAWLMLPFLGIILMFLMPRGKRIEPFMYFVGVLIASALPIVKFNSAVASGVALNLIKWYLIGVFASLIVTYAISFFVSVVNKINVKVGIAIAAAIGIFVLAAGYIIFTTQVPLTLKHDVEEPDSIKSVTRFVSAEPDRVYVLKYDVVAKNSSNKDWAYGIIINSRNENDQAIKIAEFYDKDNFIGEKTIEFSTLKDTKRLAITFVNNFRNTSVTFTKAQIYPKNAPYEVQNIMLKYKYLPEDIASRVQDIDFTSRSSSQRMQFYKDGFKIFKDYPIFGAGGGAWASLYFKYQSYLYWTTQTHNYFMQVLLDTGIIGAIAIMFLLLSLFRGMYRVYKGYLEEKDRILISAVITAIVSLYAHAAMDFDLSLSAVSIALWALIGVINSLDILKVKVKNKKIYLNYLAIVVAFVVMFMSTSMSVALSYAVKGDNFLRQQNLILAEQNYEKAVSYDPWNAKYRMTYGQILTALGDQLKDAVKLQKAMFEEEKAVQLEPFNSQLNAQLGAFYLAHGQIDLGLKYVLKAVEVQPLRPENYQQLADAYNKVGMYYLNNGDKEKAKEFLQKAVDVQKMFDKANSKSLEPKPMTEMTKQIIEESQKTLQEIH
ncbi:tetratricopeptide repeat/O-antigen ligase [Thermoanaerobacter kivui]|uniref:Tetratricopeptide repeat/O-antigen ligase n=1 Tax=Thermoanaerobacter kivui TaxID=2325 RepID=A0A097APT6_THEKI|nr:O-antigen ligase family protein [Thermoanaerobacter kivui]AIS51839.1 tetratricopeptide repeat/O-antigen ligase [Thermoanaerobacter kivui]